MRICRIALILEAFSAISSVVAFSVHPVHQKQSTFHSHSRPKYRIGTSLFDLPPSEVVVTDDWEKAVDEIESPTSIEEAIEALEQQTASAAKDEGPYDDGKKQVVVQSEGKESKIVTSKEKLAGDIIESMTTKESDRTDLADREAAVSASLYMNPATGKIASNLIITWEPAVAEILDRMERLSNPSRPLMVGLVGIPGSGKSTSADIVTTLLGGMDDSQDEERAIVMPMDGYHLPLQTLAQSENSADLIYRRGAPDTFDPESLLKALNEIAYGNFETVTLPGFDHAQGDPVPNQHTFKRSKHKIVIVEGIYLLHDDDGWEPIKRLFDWTIYIDADVDACIERLKIRNKCIPGYTPEEIEARCDIVDRRNAELSRDSAHKYASQIVNSGAS